MMNPDLRKLDILPGMRSPNGMPVLPRQLAVSNDTIQALYYFPGMIRGYRYHHEFDADIPGRSPSFFRRPSGTATGYSAESDECLQMVCEKPGGSGFPKEIVLLNESHYAASVCAGEQCSRFITCRYTGDG